MSRPGANATPLSTERFPLQTPHTPRVGSAFRWCVGPWALRFSAHRGQQQLGYRCIDTDMDELDQRGHM
ncbi:hypothetical protein NDU88_005388 [Pleurodeles waltl]|uniref:Uncharacterized protein n=1 Tax=Pleurodeles waltl TaxID=8319 RepID=A0AAV7TAC1_PLEWA|nr:hypothetical protein NDU88_005388 [Pleurodeles waltl]